MSMRTTQKRLDSLLLAINSTISEKTFRIGIDRMGYYPSIVVVPITNVNHINKVLFTGNKNKIDDYLSAMVTAFELLKEK